MGGRLFQTFPSLTKNTLLMRIPETLPKVAVIMVHYENYALKFFGNCFESLDQQSPVNAQVTFYVVDNGASDESKRFVKKLAPHYRCLDNIENKGWASGNNLAVRTALSEGADTLVLLNMDTSLDADWLKNLLEAANADPDTHIFQSKKIGRAHV